MRYCRQTDTVKHNFSISESTTLQMNSKLIKVVKIDWQKFRWPKTQILKIIENFVVKSYFTVS